MVKILRFVISTFPLDQTASMATIIFTPISSAVSRLLLMLCHSRTTVLELVYCTSITVVWWCAVVTVTELHCHPSLPMMDDIDMASFLSIYVHTPFKCNSEMWWDRLRTIASVCSSVIAPPSVQTPVCDSWMSCRSNVLAADWLMVCLNWQAGVAHVSLVFWYWAVSYSTAGLYFIRTDLKQLWILSSSAFLYYLSHLHSSMPNRKYSTCVHSYNQHLSILSVHQSQHPIAVCRLKRRSLSELFDMESLPLVDSKKDPAIGRSLQHIIKRLSGFNNNGGFIITVGKSRRPHN